MKTKSVLTVLLVVAASASSYAHARVELSTTFLNFSGVEIGESGPLDTVFVTNVGDKSTQISMSNSCSSDFAVSHTCNLSLDPEAQCLLNVQFTPRREGYQSCSIWASDIDGSVTLNVSGNGVN